MEAFYISQAVLDQRAASALFDATFGQARQALGATASFLADLRRQLVVPAGADLSRLRRLVGAAAAGITYWLDRFNKREEAGTQAGSAELEMEPWLQLVAALPDLRPRSPLQPRDVAASIVQLYTHGLEQVHQKMAADRCGDDALLADRPAMKGLADVTCCCGHA